MAILENIPDELGDCIFLPNSENSMSTLCIPHLFFTERQRKGKFDPIPN